MKKILFLCFSFLLMLSLLTVTGYAEEALPDGGTQSDPSASLPTEELSQASSPDTLLQSAGNTLLACLSLIGSLLVTFLYKSGAISSMRTGMSSLEELFSKSRAVTEECSKNVHVLEERIALLERALAQEEAPTPRDEINGESPSAKEGGEETV